MSGIVPSSVCSDLKLIFSTSYPIELIRSQITSWLVSSIILKLFISSEISEVTIPLRSSLIPISGFALKTQIFGKSCKRIQKIDGGVHLEEAPTGTITDSTGNNEDGSTTGSMNSGDLVLEAKREIARATDDLS